MREKRDFPSECKMLVSISKHQHELDVKHNREPLGFFPKKREDSRSESAQAFEKKWLGRS